MKKIEGKGKKRKRRGEICEMFRGRKTKKRGSQLRREEKDLNTFPSLLARLFKSEGDGVKGVVKRQR